MQLLHACRFLSPPLLFSLLFLPFLFMFLSIRWLFSLLERSIRCPFYPCSLSLPSTSLLSLLLLPRTLTDPTHSTIAFHSPPASPSLSLRCQCSDTLHPLSRTAGARICSEPRAQAQGRALCHTATILRATYPHLGICLLLNPEHGPLPFSTPSAASYPLIHHQ
jgi:hypothetical protein